MLEAIGLTKIYDGKRALDALDLKVAPGEVYCLLGANGAGKTTTINLFLGFIPPTSGKALIGDLDVAAHSGETKKYVAYIPENVMLYPALSGLENLDFFCALAGKKYPKNELSDFLSRSGLQEEAHHQRLATYSKGMRQKVGISIALAKDAKALLLDEPTSGLDPQASNEFASILGDMSRQKISILMATHDLFRAKESGTHIGIMKKGRLVESLTTEEIGHADLEKLYLRHMKD
jgi:ABC-2 type transport system ATP-binding protein